MKRFKSILDVKPKSLAADSKKFEVAKSDLKVQLKKGEKVEREHTTHAAAAKRIAMDHLGEIPDYYDRLKKLEDKAKKRWEKK